jgi:signal transduction histidine kinase
MRRRIQQVKEGEPLLVPREYPATRRDGRAMIAEIVSTIVSFQGAPAVLAFARDVTERSRLRAQLAHADRLAAMGAIAAGVAHEINNPLGFMRLATEVFERKLGADEKSPQLLALARDLRDGIDRVEAIVRDLRLFGRYEDEPIAATDPVTALDAAMRLVAHEVLPRARLVREHGALPPVLGVGTRLEQVFVNLLLNAAFAFSETGKQGEIIVRGTATDTSVVIEVSDDGPGIAPDVLARVFEPFFTMKPSVGGTGLGLSICRGIVERAGGAITALSEPGRGTTMRVVLPRAPTSPAGVAASAPKVAAKPDRKLRVLVVDDEERIVSLVRDLLDTHDVIGETSSVRALDVLLAGEDFDVVLCDLMMPELSGMELHEKVAAARPELARRFVFVSGGAYTERGRSAFSSAAIRLMKPFSESALNAALAAASKASE